MINYYFYLNMLKLITIYQLFGVIDMSKINCSCYEYVVCMFHFCVLFVTNFILYATKNKNDCY